MPIQANQKQVHTRKNRERPLNSHAQETPNLVELRCTSKAKSHDSNLKLTEKAKPATYLFVFLKKMEI